MMAELPISVPSNWVPEFEFEVWSLGIDCKKFYAGCCWDLARAAVNQQDQEILSTMAKKLDEDIIQLSNKINCMIDILLCDFYACGGRVLPGCLGEATKKQVRNQLNEIEAFELLAGEIVTARDFTSAVEFAEKQGQYYQKMFRYLADLYPEGEVRKAFVQLSA